jgi:PAS domain S-box-containing protein
MWILKGWCDLSEEEGLDPGWALGPDSGRGGLLFRNGVRLWHFIVLPPVTMAALVAVAHWVDPAVRRSISDFGYHAYSVARGSAISLAMASLIAYLAFRHKRDYEAKLRAHTDALESTRDFLSRLISSSAEAIVTIDPDARVTSWNLAAERIYGWKADEIVGRSSTVLLPPDPGVREDGDRVERIVRSGQAVRDHEVAGLHKDGHKVDVRITRWPIFDAAGAYVGSTGIVRDVSRIKEMEAKLVEAERMAAVGELAASVAHEIKNPLAGIRGACEIISDLLPKEDPRRELSTEVHRQIDRLDRTLRDLLLFSRPPATKLEPSDLHGAIEHVLAVLLGDAQARGVSVVRRYAGTMPEVLLDARQMEQVFFNILLNAFQAMDFSGTVTITTEADEREVRVRIRDTGSGIPEENSERIFKPFFTTRSKGTGLGLAIVRNIMNAHGGRIVAATSPEGGAEVVLALPRNA